MNTFENLIQIPLEGRTQKPRDTGLTMMIDKGLGVAQADSLTEIAHQWIDIAKLAFGTSRLCPRDVVARKIEVYRSRDIHVMPGGTFLEVVVAQGKLDEFLAEAKEVGFNAM